MSLFTPTGAVTGCPLSPDPGEFTLKHYKCSDESWNKISRPRDNDCDIEDQTTCD